MGSDATATPLTMNRYFSREVRVEVHAERGALLSEAFASETDLGSGSTRPRSLAECSARRAGVHWPMDTYWTAST